MLDTTTAKLRAIGSVAGGADEAYGMCLAATAGGADAFIVLKDGTINQVAIDLSGAAPAGRIVRTMKLATQSEGCVVDPRTQRLYVAEEDVGIWRFDARRDGATTAIPVAKVDGRTLVADVEGLALAGDGSSRRARATMPTRSTRWPTTAMSGASESRPGHSARRAKPTESRSSWAISARTIAAA